MHILNPSPRHGAPLLPRDAETFGDAGVANVAALLAACPAHKPTPLSTLPGLAKELGVGALHLKDEGHRLGLGSFKALGGAYVVMQLVREAAEEKLARPVAPAELMSDEIRAIARTMTFACATDGNHGRSVARGAQLVGANSAIFMHGGVTDARVAAIAQYGADIHRVDGSYDDSIVVAARMAEENGWITLSDTSWDGYEYIPSLVMQGYTMIVEEALAALDQPPTHVFIQSGVGGIAAAMAARLAIRLGDRRPHFTVVDPARAACLFESAKAGEPVQVEEGEPTIMAMLECFEPSMIAFDVLERTADSFMAVEEDLSPQAMRRLAAPTEADPPVVSGESGCAGLAGLMEASGDNAIRTAMGLDEESRVLVVNTEGATDPALYERIVGKSPEEVQEGRQAT